MKKYLKFSSLGVAALFLMMLFFSGCETWKGIQKDFQTLTDWDKKFQEKYW